MKTNTVSKSNTGETAITLTLNAQLLEDLKSEAKKRGISATKLFLHILQTKNLNKVKSVKLSTVSSDKVKKQFFIRHIPVEAVVKIDNLCQKYSVDRHFMSAALIYLFLEDAKGKEVPGAFNSEVKGYTASIPAEAGKILKEESIKQGVSTAFLLNRLISGLRSCKGLEMANH